MYIEAVPNRNSPPAVLLRESYREAGRTRTRTLANLTRWPTEGVEGLRTLLQGGTAVAPTATRQLTATSALPHGPGAAALGMARKLDLQGLLLGGRREGAARWRDL